MVSVKLAPDRIASCKLGPPCAFLPRHAFPRVALEAVNVGSSVPRFAIVSRLGLPFVLYSALPSRVPLFVLP